LTWFTLVFLSLGTKENRVCGCRVVSCGTKDLFALDQKQEEIGALSRKFSLDSRIVENPLLFLL
jgi:hypothetical protein